MNHFKKRAMMREKEREEVHHGAGYLMLGSQGDLADSLALKLCSLQPCGSGYHVWLQ